MEVVDKIKKFLSEGDQVYHKSYSSAVQYALDQAKKKGFTYDDDEYFSIVATGTKKPSVGKTTKFSLPLYKGEKKVKPALHVQVYGMDSGNYELNYYIS
ncbi:MAG: hypothetical protein RBS24_07160 [Bacilli bacterium]|nr:hypothetical protein [Bacilli bacterium]